MHSSLCHASYDCSSNHQPYRYTVDKKKNGTKSNLVKCYIERIAEDCVGLLASRAEEEERGGGGGEGGGQGMSSEWKCPTCQTTIGRDAMIRGQPAIKLAGGKTRMTKK